MRTTWVVIGVVIVRRRKSLVDADDSIVETEEERR